MSKQQLTLEHLAPYLPYKVKIQTHGIMTGIFSINPDYGTVKFIDEDNEPYNTAIFNIKPILRPLSDLTKEIEHNGEKFVPLIKMGLPNKTSVYNDITYVIKKGHTPYIEMQKLLEWQFDVFSLIDKKLAINLNDLKDEKRDKI